MARRKAAEENSNGTWLNTYADMVTLLLTFFVMLFSMSTTQNVNKQQEVMTEAMQQIAQSAKVQAKPMEAPNIAETLPKDFEELYAYIKEYVEQHKLEGSIEVKKVDGNVFIRFRDSIFFDPDRFELKSSSRGILDFLGDCLKSVEDQVMTVNINGHTAAVDNMYYPVSDWRLSSQRASSVAIFFADEKQLDPRKILPIGYGKNYPVDTNATAEGRRNNRRVDMLIVGTESMASNEQLVNQLLKGTFDQDQYPDIGAGQDILIPPVSDVNKDPAP